MADIQIVMQVVGEKSIVNATKSTVNLENKVKSLSKSLEAGRISESQFSTGLKELRRTLDGNGKAWQSNKAQIDNYVKSLRSAEAAQKAATAAQEAAKKQAQSVREMNAALAAQRKAQDENTASLSRLRAGYD
jgi:chromosome segregation ATPase